MSISAMKQALKFCEDIGDLTGPYPYVNETQIVSDSRKVLTALRQAIAEAEKQEPVAQCTYPKCQATNGCTGACSKTAPTALAEITKEPVAFVSGLYNAPVHASDISQERVDETAKDKHEDWYGQHQWQCGYERGWDAAMEQKEKNS